MTTSLRTITHVEAGVTKDQWELTLDCGHSRVARDLGIPVGPMDLE